MLCADLEQARREAEMHAERKQAAWTEAQQAGTGGASMEGSHLTHLKEKIKDMGVRLHTHSLHLSALKSPVGC